MALSVKDTATEEALVKRGSSVRVLKAGGRAAGGI